MVRIKLPIVPVLPSSGPVLITPTLNAIIGVVGAPMQPITRNSGNKNDGSGGTNSGDDKK
jgi:hypothetical protein